MDLTNKATLIGGIALIALPVCLVVFIAGRGDVGDNDPFEKTEVAAYLAEVEDNKELTRVAFGFGIAVDTFLVLVVAAVAYILFRDRDNLLAALAIAAFVANGAVPGVTDGLGIALTFVADDFVNGGPGDMAAGDPAAFEAGRVIGMTVLALTQIQVTSFGLAELALGALITFAPAGLINPPRLFGWISMISGAAAIIAWGIVAADAFFVFLIINSLGTLVLLFGLGGWLIMNRQLAPPLMAVTRVERGSA